MRIIEKIFQCAEENKGKVAVGVQTVSDELIQSITKVKELNYAEPIIICPKKITIKPEIDSIKVNNPIDTLISMLKNNEIDAAVRGTLSAHKVLTSVQEHFHITNVLRIALLQTAQGYPFFLAPIGIDEGKNIDEKIQLIDAGIKLHKYFGITPKVAIIAGGRKEDVGRNQQVDISLEEAEKIISLMAESHIEISNYEILIEEAISNQSTLIIAPNGVSGNLIFRTLTFLGGGKAIGAPYMGVPRPLIDVSRSMTEISNAIAFASSLIKL